MTEEKSNEIIAFVEKWYDANETVIGAITMWEEEHCKHPTPDLPKRERNAEIYKRFGMDKDGMKQDGSNTVGIYFGEKKLSKWKH